MKKLKKTAIALAALLTVTSALHAETKISATPTGKGTPKYVFVFVGDGMSYPQIQSATYFAGKDAAGIVDVVKNSEKPSDSPEMKALSFYQFPVAGSASTYDATSFAPDSASTATSIFTGYKTHSSSINVDITKKIKYRTIADSDSMNYDNDRKDGEWSLRDYVRKGIEVLDNKTGFFMMVEGGKVDWACHANDVRSSIADTLALSEAVEEAIEFYNNHPKETLIIVTANHETGGLTIGYAGTDYNLFFRTLDGQKISYAKFDSDYVSAYKKNGGLVLTDYELDRIKTAYEKTIKNDKTRSQQEYDLYGTYEPLTITITHVLNAKSGLGWTSNSHTGLPVPVFALGAGQEEFKGFYDNTEIYNKMAKLTKIIKD